MILVVTYAAAALVVAGYVWFLIWRQRTTKRREEMAQGPSLSMPIIPPLTTPQGTMPGAPEGRTTSMTSTSTPTPTSSATPAAVPPMPNAFLGTARSGRSLAEMLAGIRLPLDLAPITMMERRPDAAEHLAFWTDAVPADSVGTSFGNELERLGFALTPIDPTVIAADREGDHLLCKMHVEAQLVMAGKRRTFPAVPDGATVIEVWIPT